MYIPYLTVMAYTAQHVHVYINTYCVYWHIINIDCVDPMVTTCYTLNTDWYMYKCMINVM